MSPTAYAVATATPSTTAFATATTTFLKRISPHVGLVAAQRWQNSDVRGRVERRACATTCPHVATSTTTITGPGEATNPARADSKADPQAHHTPIRYQGASAT